MRRWVLRSSTCSALIPLILSALSLSNANAQPCPDWKMRTPPPGIPSTTSRGTVVFDALRGRTLAIGRTDLSEPTVQTWEWNGTTWSLNPAIGPEWSSYSTAYDSFRNRLVAYGPGSVPLTYEFDGATWELRTSANLPALDQVTMAFDEVRGKTVLFGFRGGSAPETWEWDGVDWVQHFVGMPSIGPSLLRAAMAFDSGRARTVLVHSEASGSVFFETWEWDGQSWTQAKPIDSPPARSEFSLAFDAVRGATLLFGGSDSNGVYFRDLWRWNGTDWTLIANGGGPSARAAPGMAFDAIRGVVVLHGGGAPGGDLFDTWEWNGTAWSLKTPLNSTPPIADGTAMAFDEFRGVSVLLGGYLLPPASTDTNQTWEWNGQFWIRRLVGGPPGIAYHSMAYDSWRHRTVVFGGAPYLSGTWEWDGIVWHLRTPTNAPSPRARSTMAFDSLRGVTVLFSGDANTPADTWEWDGSNWSARATAIHPTARYSHAMAFDWIRGVCVLFGGQNAFNVANNETWEWNGTAWLQRFPAVAPSPRYGHGMIFDSARGVTILVGGNAGPTENWEWNGTNWSELPLAPNPIYPGDTWATTFDSRRGIPVAYSGGRTWELTNCPVAPIIRQEPLGAAVCSGGPFRISVVATGLPLPEYRWRHNGVELVNGGSVAGADTPNLLISPSAESDSGNYDVVVTNSEGSDTSDAASLVVFPSGSGDGNFDNHADISDLAGLLNTLLQAGVPSAAYCAYDMNHDGVVSGPDIQLFVALITAP